MRLPSNSGQKPGAMLVSVMSYQFNVGITRIRNHRVDRNHHLAQHQTVQLKSQVTSNHEEYHRKQIVSRKNQSKQLVLWKSESQKKEAYGASSSDHKLDPVVR